MTLDQLAEILEAGWRAIPGKSEPPANALARALDAMARRARLLASQELADADET